MQTTANYSLCNRKLYADSGPWLNTVQYIRKQMQEGPWFWLRNFNSSQTING